MTETWVVMKNHNVGLCISSYGRIKRVAVSTLKRSRYGQTTWHSFAEKPCIGEKLSAKGYQRVRIANKTHQVHRLVAEYFIPNPENKPQINHKDGNKTNNKVSNLEWVTNQENRTHAVNNKLHVCGEAMYNAKLTEAKVKEIRYLYDITKLTQKEIGELFNVNQQLVSKICLRHAWKHID
jgi:hypothetical protein